MIFRTISFVLLVLLGALAGPEAWIACGCDAHLRFSAAVPSGSDDIRTADG